MNSEDERERTLRRMRELFSEWKGKNEHRDFAMSSMKNKAAKMRLQRKKKIEWALVMEDKLREARLELGNDAGPVLIARWFNANHIFTHMGNRFHGSNLGELYGIDRSIIGDAVMECRARMSAIAMSADFELTRSEIHPLEHDCIQKAKKAILLARRLERLSAITDADLTREAIRKSAEEASRQRGDYLPMMARDCYLTMAEFDEVVPSMERLSED